MPRLHPDVIPICFIAFSFPKVKTVLRGKRFQDVEDIKKKRDGRTEHCSSEGGLY
jgi:hypothetical protein